MLEAKERLLSMLKDCAFKRGDFTLSSGKKSDFLIDCKKVALSALGHRLIGEVMYDAAVRTTSARAVAGVALGGCPLASAVSLFSYASSSLVDAIYVRKAQKGHGSKNLLEVPATVETGATVVLLEDVTTTGGSALHALHALKEGGFDVYGVCTLVDRCEGGEETIKAAGFQFWSVFDKRAFLP